MRTKAIQAKHIPDAQIIVIIRGLQAIKRAEDPKFYANLDEQPWTSRWDIEEAIPEVPCKVVLAKLRSMVKRKLLDGCTCGCRGDFTILCEVPAILDRPIVGGTTVEIDARLIVDPVSGDADLITTTHWPFDTSDIDDN